MKFSEAERNYNLLILVFYLPCKENNITPEISTSSLPVIVFILLFVFMTVTVMKNDTLNAANELPNASEIKKLEKKDHIITVYIGKPRKSFDIIIGAEPKI